MKNSILFIILFSALSSFGQDFRVPYRIGELWGYADKSGKIIVEPKYDWVANDQDNFRWFVYKDEKMGVVDKEGNEILQPVYDTIVRDPKHSEYNDYYIVKNGLVGYTTMDGHVLVAPEYADLIACDYNDRSHFREAYNFLVKGSDLWKLIDTNGTVYMDEINQFRNDYNGVYLIKAKEQWGIYNVEEKFWYVPAKYDSINTFQYGDWNYRPKQEYANFYYYAKKGDSLFIIDENAATIPFGKGSIDTMFVKVDDLWLSESVEEVIPDDDGSKLQRIDLIPVDGNGCAKIKWGYGDKKWSICSQEKSNKFGLEISHQMETYSIEAKYDSICTYLYGSGYMESEYFFLFQGEKMGVYGINEHDFVVPMSKFDSFQKSDFRNTFIFTKNGNVGILNTGWNRFTVLTYIPPEYEKFLKWAPATSLDKDYKVFSIYYFMKNGKICPVGENGVHFYDQ